MSDSQTNLERGLEYALLERALASSQSGMVITDALKPDHPIAWCNQGFIEMTGYDAAEIIGRNCRFLQGKDTDPEKIRALRESVAAGKDCRVDIVNYRKNGKAFLNTLHISPIGDETGQITHFVGVQMESPLVGEEEMEKIHAYAAAVVDTVHEPLLILDTDFRVVSANLAFYTDFKVTPAETEGKSVYALGANQWDTAALRGELDNVLKQNSIVRDFQVTQNFPRIGPRTMRLNARLVGSLDEEPPRILLAFEDITHQKPTLDSSVDFARSILDALSSHVAILDGQGVIVAVNDAWNQFASKNGTDMNAAQGAFVGANYLQVCEAADGECADEAKEMVRGIRSVLAGEVRTFECEYPCHAAHEKRWFVGRVTRLDYAGRLYLVVTHENITTRKLSEQALHATEERYRHLVENVDEYAIVTMDDTGIITGWNQGAQAIFGYQEAEILGKSAQTLFPADARARGALEKEMEIARAHGKTADSCDLIRRDGSVFFAEGVLFTLYDDEKHPIGFGKLLRDFTQRHQSEQAIQELNARLHRAMTETHHRVKNNLQMITALIDMERMQSKNSDMEEELTRLSAHVLAMAGVHDLLTQSSRLDGTADTLSARAVLETLFSSIESMAGGRHIAAALQDVTLSVQQGTSLALIANELVLNALKHGDKLVEVSFRVKNGVARLVVCDDGPGFSDDFSPESDDNLGLQLIAALVEIDMKGGIVFANRDAECGAEVTVTFPVI